MSRIAKAPVDLPQGVTATIAPEAITIKGAKGSLSLALKSGVTVEQAEKVLNVKYGTDDAIRMQAGATRAHLANMVEGVSKGFERRLELQGVGYRAQAQGKVLNLTLGYSHPVNFAVPDGITIETPTQTEILIKGIDRQVVGETADSLIGRPLLTDQEQRRLREKLDSIKGEGAVTLAMPIQLNGTSFDAHAVRCIVTCLAETTEQCFGFLPPVGLDDRNHHVDAFL